MSFNSAAVIDLFSALVSHAQLTGIFESVSSHEPKNAPLNGLTCALWVQSIDPVLSSGLDQTSGRVTFNVRIYENMFSEPQDQIDIDVLAATCLLMNEYSGNFTLGGTVREIDLLGDNGDSLSAKAGFLNHDNRLFRVMDITLPVIINDMFGQVA